MQSTPTSDSYTYSVCDVDQERVDHWLRTPYIDRRDGVSLHIEVSFTIRACSKFPNPKDLKQCRETFSIMYLQSDGPDERLASKFNADTTYQLALTVAPDKKWIDHKSSTSSVMNTKTATIDVGRRGLYVAFRDQGSCVALYQVRIYYLECSERTKQFALYPRTPAPHGDQFRMVNARCVSGAAHTGHSSPSGVCVSNGLWAPSTGQSCTCKPGYYAIQETRCVGECAALCACVCVCVCVCVLDARSFLFGNLQQDWQRARLLRRIHQICGNVAKYCARINIPLLFVQ